VTVTSSAGSTTGTVNITVNGPPANVTYPAVVFGVGILDTGRGAPTATGPVTKWSITPAPPAGLAMDTLTGKFSGQASEAISGSAHTVTARNQYGSSSVAMTISVLNPIVLFNYATKNFTLVAGTPMTSASPIVAGTIPFTPVTYAVSPALPAGINLNANTGAISGTPTTGSQLSTKHTVTARNGVPSFNKTDTLTFLVQTTAIRLGRAGGLSPALFLDGRMLALAPPEGTKNLRVTLRDMTGRVLLDRSVEWNGSAHVDGMKKSAAGVSGIMALRVQFMDENGRSLGRTEQRIPLLAE
jgi:Putative Ig domain